VKTKKKLINVFFDYNFVVLFSKEDFAFDFFNFAQSLTFDDLLGDRVFTDLPSIIFPKP